MNLNPMEDPGVPALCPNWVYSSILNCHVARDREWFSDDYIPFSAQFKTDNEDKVPFTGIGTVMLRTKTSPYLMGLASHGRLRLDNVLHAPNAPCSVIGNPVIETYRVGVNLIPSIISGLICELDGRPWHT
ncbi:hypothetical protein N7508_001853 [Penicillium antarcticum]|uniref:uncharacterized protein n=1 Tax=Penicillium antarcticum TaxID=416450 RepID=UPI0023A26055|nr:uncharacterized protein N7508_001853 [Penicillium antarcticum]KAJ5317345.1 hypothetical protein N7508_001853 [Penicillium antarcticum]